MLDLNGRAYPLVLELCLENSLGLVGLFLRSPPPPCHLAAELVLEILVVRRTVVGRLCQERQLSLCNTSESIMRTSRLVLISKLK